MTKEQILKLIEDKLVRKNSGSSLTNDLAEVANEITKSMGTDGDGVDPDPMHYHIGDIVMWSDGDNKMIKTTKDAYNLDSYPADNFTPIGVVFYVNPDGTARMISLASMSASTPDSGSSIPETMYWGGYDYDIPEMDNYEALGIIDESGVVSSQSANGALPLYSYTALDKLSLDKLRYYGSGGVGLPLPSPYNEDGTDNEEYYKIRTSNDQFYQWSRYNESMGYTYYIYTDKPSDQLDDSTKLYGASLGHNSFVVNYGFPQSGSALTYLGLITDTSIYDGGISNFISDFTYDDVIVTSPLLANSDMDGRGNTDKILSHQNELYVFDKSIGGDTINNNGDQMYSWTRYNDSDGNNYWFYTNSENITDDTELWILGYGDSSFIVDYGTTNPDNGTNWIMVGTVGDGTHITTGTSGFGGIYTRDPEGEKIYYWSRYNESDGKTYHLYTGDDEDSLTTDTKIYIQGNTSDSFVFNYGTINQYGGSTWYEMGTLGDPSIISGGVEEFLENFNRQLPVAWKESESLLNNYDKGNYPAACSTWRYSTPGTEQGDWYFPAMGECGLISANYGYLGESLQILKKLRPDLVISGLGTSYYFSSTEYSATGVYGCYFYDGCCSNNIKDGNGCVRAVSAAQAL